MTFDAAELRLLLSRICVGAVKEGKLTTKLQPS
jgi:hypothetical protein